MYSFESLIKNEFVLSYSTMINQTDSSIYELAIKDNNQNINSEYTYTPKSTYDGEENFSLVGNLTNKKEESYNIEGAKGGLFGYYNNTIKMYIDNENTYGFSVTISQDLLSEQIILLREFRNNESNYLSEIEIKLVQETINDNNKYYVVAKIDNFVLQLNHQSRRKQ